MELKFIERLIRLVNENDIDMFEYSQSGEKIRIIRRHPQSRGIQNNAPMATTYQHPIFPSEEYIKSVSSSPTPEKKSVNEVSNDTFIEITSPMVGTFYRAPAPDAEPYVKVGDTIEPGQVLCILEAMKLMNEFQSEHSGKIVDILAKNAQPVEFGQPLFRIERT